VDELGQEMLEEKINQLERELADLREELRAKPQAP
jgi:hypothetical protein